VVKGVLSNLLSILLETICTTAIIMFIISSVYVYVQHERRHAYKRKMEELKYKYGDNVKK